MVTKRERSQEEVTTRGKNRKVKKLGRGEKGGMRKGNEKPMDPPPGVSSTASRTMLPDQDWDKGL